jgi:hypothetical protein
MKRFLWVALLVVACGGTQASATNPPATSGPASTDAAAAAGSPAASAGPEFEGAFAPITFKGKGNKTVTFEIPEDAIALASLTHPGKGKFEVRAYGEDGKETQTLVKTAGNYRGVVLFDLVEHSTSFKVSAAGSWKIIVKPTETAADWDGTKTLKGRGDSVVGLATPSEADDTVDLVYSGKGRFAVRAHTPEDEIWIVDVTGKYKGRKDLPDGTAMLEIRAKGAWSIKPGE